jgi:hypothetical protein
LAQDGIDLVVVRKSGPVQSLSIKTWWVYLVLGGVLFMLPLVGVGAWVVYRQSGALNDMLDETRLLQLRAERLESLVQEQETRDILTQQSLDEKPGLDRPRSKGASAAAASSDQAMAEEARREVSALDRKAAEAALAGEPTSSGRLSIRNIEQKAESGDLVVTFEMINERDFSDPAMGYITVVARGVRQGKPWVEAWPPMRLTALGRPQNYRRGTPFSVQRYRKVKARVAALADKKLERLEFVVYNRQGDLVMVQTDQVSLSPSSRNLNSDRGDG